MRLVVLVILKQGQKIKVKVTSKTKKHYDVSRMFILYIGNSI